MIWAEILEKLQQLDMWSMGIGIILTVAAFFVWTQVKKNKKKSVVKQMTERLAIFFGAPALAMFVLAQIFQQEWMVWVFVGLLTIAAVFFAFDQM